MSDFARLVARFFDAYFALDPLAATAAGMHAHDGRWPDLTPAGHAAILAFLDEWEVTFRGLDAATLDRDGQIDRDLIVAELEARRFHESEFLATTWDPLGYVSLLGHGLFPLLAREFAPPADRLASLAGRMAGVPAVLDSARALLGSAERPVSRFHTEHAIRQLAGVGDLCDDAVRLAGEAAPGDPAVAAVAGEVRSAASTARVALAAFGDWLESDLLPRAEGEGRLGPELFARRLRHTLGTDMPAAELLDRAEGEFRAVRAEMIRIAGEMWPHWLPDRPRPTATSEGTREAADSALVRAVLDAIAVEHPTADAVLDFCRAELARVEAFVGRSDLIGLPEDPLEITWTPTFMRAYGGAFLDPPGPLDKGQKSFFFVTPIPDDWSPERAESYLREDNARMLRLLTIHEGVPGHYLQLVAANACPSLARAVFWSGVFAEGWAVYITQVMIDAGFDAEDPALLLTHWKFYLRAATNAIIDVRIHAHGMTEADAIGLMVQGGFQEEAEAVAKYQRARLTSTQLSTYFVGSVLFWELERDRRIHLARRSGDPRGGDAVPRRSLPGGFGETPGFRYRAWLETVLGHGSPPLPLLRRIVLDEVT